jgi:hypothetical protein
MATYRRSLDRVVIAALLAMACISTLVFSTPAAQAAAEPTHLFDAARSLTGDCSTSEIDSVPDPGPCPGVAGVDHPEKPFNNPNSVATDSYGNIYVSSVGPELDRGVEGRIDVFDPEGHFITEIADDSGPARLAIDSKGNLYVGNLFTSVESLVRYTPTATYEPAAGKIEYGGPPAVVVKTEATGGLAINPVNDHLFLKRGFRIDEYSSAAEGNTFVGAFGEGKLQQEANGIALDAAHERIYATTWQGTPGNITKAIRVFELAPPHNLLFTVGESAVPGGKFVSAFFSLAADESNGHFFLYDGEARKVDEFDQNGTYLSAIEHGFKYSYLSQISVDNGAHSPHGGLDPDGRYLFVPSHPTNVPSRAFAFEPKPVPKAPVIESSSIKGVTEVEAVLGAKVNPKAEETTYRFEYTTQESFDEEGFAGATLGGEGTLPAVNEGVAVSAALSGLSPDTAYRFRVIAENEAGQDEEQSAFRTYRPLDSSVDCSNEALRTGLSAALPDCRAYELVSPANTGGHIPLGLGHLGMYFATRQASPQGNALTFHVEGGAIPGYEGSGALQGEPYRASRGPSGWSTEAIGPLGSEAVEPNGGSPSPDQGYSFWSTGGPRGSASIEDKPTTYVRYPDGHSELIGRGSIGSDPQASGKLISENGEHVIFTTGATEAAVQLEPDAPPSGTAAVYDRTADEVTHVVSLLPGDVTPAAGATYEGASLDGRGVAFSIFSIGGSKLYLRYEDAQTFEIATGATFEGVAKGGARIFYLKGGDIYRFDAQSEETTPFAETGDAIPVNVSADGSAAYFVSPTAIPVEPNPHGDVPHGGAENLYLSQEGAISFLGIVTEGDVKGEAGAGGLGLWITDRPGADPSRSTADGSVLLFESRANLVGFDPEGHREIYRYDAGEEALACLSCNSIGANTSGDATLQSFSRGFGDLEPLTPNDTAINLSANGRRAVFQSTEALLAADTDGLQDVYEWEAQDEGSCRTEGGCLYLISSGESADPNYLYGMSADGKDIFFRTTDLLLPERDPDETASIYDARAGGGFPSPAGVAGECLGEACQPAALAPNDPTPASSSFEGSGNVKEEPKAARCPRGKRAVKSRGKTRCVAQHKKHSNKRANAKGRTHR